MRHCMALHIPYAGIHRCFLQQQQQLQAIATFTLAIIIAVVVNIVVPLLRLL